MPADFKAKQLEFTRYIRNPELYSVPEDVKPERMAMYRELIFNNINSFLASNFPVIRKILDDQQWFDLVQNFFSSHSSKTPYFSEIAEEFLEYLENERNSDDDFPFLLELAHYEWVEMALSVLKEEADLSEQKSIDELRHCTIKLSPLALPLVYRFPVHLIDPEYLPLTPPAQPTFIVVYRNLEDEVKFMEVAPMTYRLLEIIDEQGQILADCLFKQVADESQHSDPEAIITGGLTTIKDLIEKTVISIVA